MRKAVLFDLDNTLFDVEQYMTGAFADVAAHLATTHGLDREQVHADLLALWRAETSMYPHLFDDIAADYGIDADIERLVAVFNDHEPTLEPYEGVPALLDRLQAAGYALGVVTDGTAHRQRRKLDALGLRSAFETVVLTAEVGEAKPSPRPFEVAARRLDLPAECCLYVGDNPWVDFTGARAVGMATIRLRRGEFRSLSVDSGVDATAETVEDIYGIVREWADE
jgi:putative hydrolase of the HAD superfamily